MDKKDSSHKQRECLEEVSKRPFQAPCDPCERRGFGVSGPGRPTVTSLKTGCVGGDKNLDQTERASSPQAWLVRSSFNPRTRPFPNRLSRLNIKTWWDAHDGCSGRLLPLADGYQASRFSPLGEI